MFIPIEKLWYAEKYKNPDKSSRGKTKQDKKHQAAHRQEGAPGLEKML